LLGSILDHETIGLAVRQGLQKGMQQKGLLIARRLLERRFEHCPLPSEQHFTQLPVPELENLSLRLLDATP
jgi:hypothetical protein